MKMLAFVSLLAAITILSVQAGPVPLEDKENFFRYHVQCLEETKVDDEITAKFCLGEEVDDPKLRDYLYCISKKFGFQNDKGELELEVIRAKLLKTGDDRKKVDALVEKCALKKETELETAYNLFDCYRKNTPDNDSIFYIISLTPVNMKKLYQYHKQCVEQTGITDNLLQTSYETEFSNDPLLKKYLVCLTKQLGFIDENGKVLKDVITEKLAKVIKETTKIDKLVELCVSEQESPEDTAYSMMKCFHEKTYINFLLPIPLSPEKFQKLAVYSKECKKQTSVDKGLVLEATVGNFTEDPALKEYLLCMSKLVGFQDADGVLQKDVLKQKIADVLNNTLASEELSEKCVVQLESAAETAYSMVKCYFEQTPSHLHIFKQRYLPLEKIEEFRKFNEECMVESGIDLEIMDQLRKNIFPEDDKLKIHIFCFSKKIGAQNEQGKFYRENLNKLGEKVIEDPVRRQKVVEDCTVMLDKPEESVYRAVVCFYDSMKFNIFSML